MLFIRYKGPTGLLSFSRQRTPDSRMDFLSHGLMSRPPWICHELKQTTTIDRRMTCSQTRQNEKMLLHLLRYLCGSRVAGVRALTRHRLPPLPKSSRYELVISEHRYQVWRGQDSFTTGLISGMLTMIRKRPN